MPYGRPEGLELASLHLDMVALGVREAIGEALGECARLNAGVSAIREMLRQAMVVEES